MVLTGKVPAWLTILYLFLYVVLHLVLAYAIYKKLIQRMEKKNKIE